ncbi:hypothetical protein QC763_107390 [Podospora pseudopauciseta]|uniref:HMG box domain-containing protein n=1 Tax=Podospora pseudopauciseta TaxID=2093780 RepID=A0ABR0HYG5_9PEZI|nr:hypothetical protein QC763_107390 [Podospora pseudopauciseta]
MTQLLSTVFGELGLAQYLDAFLEQGFDTWETILDITESDLDTLGVKLGHRRKLQRRIANTRGIAPDASLVSPTQPSIEELRLQDAQRPDASRQDARDAGVLVVTKRKYRRHPKPDENAPERPPSAYVLFSNKMREELKGRNLSFTEIAKLVGENWQSLNASEKEPYESQAQAIKERYLSDLAEYKKTPEYKKYMLYLQEFKAKHGSPPQDKDTGKRMKMSDGEGSNRTSPPRTDQHRSSRSGSQEDSRRSSEPPASRGQRLGSIVSMSESQYSTATTPGASHASPRDEPIHSPTISKTERHERSPALNSMEAPSQRTQNWRDEPPNMQRHLPSLSDVFEGQRFPGGMHSVEMNGYRFPREPLPSPNGHPGRIEGGDSRPPTLKSEQSTSGSTSSGSPFGQPRTPVDGQLPIHALLTSKPDHFDLSQQQHQQYPLQQRPPHIFQGGPYPSGAGTLPAINGYARPVLSQPPVTAHSSSVGYPSLASAQAPAHPRQSRHPHPQAGNPDAARLDGMSALLQAGEIVNRRAQ